MREILSQLNRWIAAGEAVAMATLVEVRHSAPRDPGARFCATAAGEVVGSVSAGCVEGDLLHCCRRVLESGRSELATYGISNEMGFEVGLSCGGEIDVLVEVFESDPAWVAMVDALERGDPVVLAQVVEPATARPRRLALADGRVLAGGIAPAVDARLLTEADEVLASGEARIVEPDSREASRVFLEPIVPARRLYVIGGTQTALHLCRLGRELGYRVIVVDPRSAFATEERFGEADELIHRWPDEVLAEADLDPLCSIVALMHDAKFDIPTLATALRSPAGYVGALGSRRTHAGRVTALRELGFSDEELARIASPIGLDLGGRSPREIALSILAEIQAARYGRPGGSLRAGQGAIHAPRERRES